MSEITAISWTNHTFNPWSGCAKVSAGCTNCYAANLPPSMRRGAEWGEGRPRVHASEDYWRQPLAWERAAIKAGERRRVFCASVADAFEDRDDLDGARARLFALIEATPGIDWLLTTKRADAIMRRVPAAWRSGFPRNVWMLVSVEDQKAADARIPWLLKVPAVVRGLSMEPLIGPVDLRGYVEPSVMERAAGRLRRGLYPVGNDAHTAPLNWIITGGESGRGARPLETAWLADIHKQAKDRGVAVHHKQMGSAWADANGATHKKGGDPDEWPEAFRLRDFPEAPHV
jgi:protein gp37